MQTTIKTKLTGYIYNTMELKYKRQKKCFIKIHVLVE